MASQLPVGSLAGAAYRLCGTGRCAATVLCSVKFRTALSTDIPVMRFIVLQGFIPIVGAGAHGERLAVALVAVVAPHINAVLVDAVFRQIADGERLALRPGMRRSINIAEYRGPVFL